MAVQRSRRCQAPQGLAQRVVTIVALQSHILTPGFHPCTHGFHRQAAVLSRKEIISVFKSSVRKPHAQALYLRNFRKSAELVVLLLWALLF